MTRSTKLEEMLTAADVTNPTEFMSFASQQLGITKPIGHKARGVAIRRIKDEMEEQNWTWKHLTSAVRYMKARGIKAKTVDYIFYFVSDAIREGFMPRPPASDWEMLEQQVTDAIYMEDDDVWVRRLTAARGSLMATVLTRWQRERLPLLSLETKTSGPNLTNVRGNV